MKRAGKAVFYAVAILLVGIFSQQETKAGDTNERHYSRAYSVLSANVGNSSDLWGPVIAELVKLQPGSDEEKKVISGIQDLKPDILILIEAFSKGQVESSICFDWDSRKPAYSVHGGPYDFVCVKNAIIAKKDNGNPDIEWTPMPGGNGNSVGYVDVGLKDEGGRRVRLFYAHFPSPQGPFSPEENAAHVTAFGWIEVMLIRAISAGIPCLIAGDLNNDFIRQRDDKSIWSAKHIYEQVAKHNLWIFNPPPNGGLRDGYYEGTYRIEQEAILQRASTIDWVMGRRVIPPDQVPGADPPSGGWAERDHSFVTNPPNWWVGSGFGDISWLAFDHKPLYGKVVFFWDKEAIGWKDYKLGAVFFSVPSDWKLSDSKVNYEDHIPGYEAWSDIIWYRFFDDKGGGPYFIYADRGPGGLGDMEIGKWPLGQLVDSFKAEIAGRSVTVGVFRFVEIEGVKYNIWAFVLTEGGKHYVFNLISADPAFQNAIFKQLVSRIRFLPKID